jgi:hypothetical protein
MAVMLVKALGYEPLVSQVEKFGGIPFEDVEENRGYIAMAKDFGLMNGLSETAFAPGKTATREEAAAILVRLYEKYQDKLQWLHGFYAFSSYEQRHAARQMDAVSFGWSQMEWDEGAGARLNLGGGGGNPWRIPDSYQSIADYLNESQVKTHLNVYMDAFRPVALPDGTRSNSLRELLTRENSREEAVAAIINEVVRPYEKIGGSPYSGVTLDFEGLRGPEMKAGYSALLARLSAELRNRGLSLYVALQPARSQGQYFDGFDYREIGRLADKVIVMAHDYHPVVMDAHLLGTDWQKNTPLTPIGEIYYGLKALTDPANGVEEREKIALALSFAAVGWRITEDDKVQDPKAIQPSMETVHGRMAQGDTLRGWSKQYRNPYMIYRTETGERIFLWYEDRRSVAEKLNLARLFGIDGVSVWRIGMIPDYQDGYDPWSDIVARRSAGGRYSTGP